MIYDSGDWRNFSSCARFKLNTGHIFLEWIQFVPETHLLWVASKDLAIMSGIYKVLCYWHCKVAQLSQLVKLSASNYACFSILNYRIQEFSTLCPHPFSSHLDSSLKRTSVSGAVSRCSFLRAPVIHKQAILWILHKKSVKSNNTLPISYPRFIEFPVCVSPLYLLLTSPIFVLSPGCMHITHHFTWSIFYKIYSTRCTYLK